MSSIKSVYQSSTTRIGQVVNTILSVVKIFAMSKRPARIEEFRLPKSAKCVVLGSGPSLKTTWLARGREESTSYIAVNTFVFSEYFDQLQPEYYMILDPGMWLADAELTRKTLALLQQKTNWSMKLFVPFTASKTHFIQQLRTHKHLEVVCVNYVVFKGFTGAAHYFFRRNLAMPQSQNVLVAALFLACNLGYKKIELWGADHDWHKSLHVDCHNVVCVKQVHFYEREEEVKYVPFFKGLHVKETFRMDEIFFAWAKVFYGYHVVRNYAESRGAIIQNATPDSFVDAFNRIN